MFVTAEISLGLFWPDSGAEIFQIPKPQPDIYIYDDSFGFEYKPNVTMERFGESEYLNSDGFRGPERKIPKPKSTYRILVIGDSVAHSMFAYDYAWTKLLEDFLNEQAGQSGPIRHYEVINTGIGGHTSYDAFLRLKRRGLKYQPDLVLVLAGWNDLVNASLTNKWFPNIRITDIRPPKVKGDAMVNNKENNQANLWQRIRKPIYRLSYTARLIRHLRITIPERLRIYRLLQERRHNSGVIFNQKALQIYSQNLESIYQTLTNAGRIRMGLVLWPIILSGETNANQDIEKKLLNHFNVFPLSAAEYWIWYNKYQDAQRDFHQRHPDVYLIDAPRVFFEKSTKERIGFFYDLCHLSKEGERLTAKFILDELKKYGIFPIKGEVPIQ